MSKIQFIFICTLFFRSLLISKFQVVRVSNHSDISCIWFILFSFTGEGCSETDEKRNSRKQLFINVFLIEVLAVKAVLHITLTIKCKFNFYLKGICVAQALPYCSKWFNIYLFSAKNVWISNFTKKKFHKLFCLHQLSNCGSAFYDEFLISLFLLYSHSWKLCEVDERRLIFLTTYFKILESDKETLPQLELSKLLAVL